MLEEKVLIDGGDGASLKKKKEPPLRWFQPGQKHRAHPGWEARLPGKAIRSSARLDKNSPGLVTRGPGPKAVPAIATPIQ